MNTMQVFRFTPLLSACLVVALFNLSASPSPVAPEVLKVNPKVLPQVSYPHWPEYRYLNLKDLSNLKAKAWLDKKHSIEGWDWSLPEGLEPSPKSLVGLQRNVNVKKRFTPMDLGFPIHPVGILWVKWKDIEKVEGQYDFKPIIERIQQAHQVGVSVILRVLSCSKTRGLEPKPSSGEAPLWLEDVGVPLLTRKAPKDNLNFDPAHPDFHHRYLKLVQALGQTKIPKLVVAAYVGYASHSFGDEGIGPHKDHSGALNDKELHVIERLDAWAEAFHGMEEKVFMGGPSLHGFRHGFGVRRGFVEMYHYSTPSLNIGQRVDKRGYRYVDESAPIIANQCFNGEVNEEYEPAWATAARGHRFGSTTQSFPYRYFMSNLRTLQMRCNYVHTTGHLIPEMLPFMALQLGRSVQDSPDVWSFLCSTRMMGRGYHKLDGGQRGVSEEELKQGIEVKNFERWLTQRDEKGFETEPAMPIQHAIKMAYIMKGHHRDHIARKGHRLGFHVDDRWTGLNNKRFALKVTYMDRGSREMILRHDSPRGKTQQRIELRNDGKLRTQTFIIENLTGNGLEHGFDISLSSNSKMDTLTISMVRLIACPS